MPKPVKPSPLPPAVKMPEQAVQVMDEKIVPPLMAEEGEEPIEDMTTMEDGYSGFDDSVSAEPEDEDETV